MIRSMTGFGRAQASVEGYNITVEIRSVNHRYFEFAAKLPKSFLFSDCGYYEEYAKLLKEKVLP